MYRATTIGWAASVCLGCCGCLTTGPAVSTGSIAASPIPRELNKAVLDEYRIEPPDILLVEVARAIRPADDPVRVGDELLVQASNVLPFDPEQVDFVNQFRLINGVYLVQADGTLDLGPEYGAVAVAGRTVPDVQEAVVTHLRDFVGLADPRVSVSLADLSAAQSIAGESLVTPTGEIDLGIYGAVFVAGMTPDEAGVAIEAQLARFLVDPRVRVSVVGYNSKVLYVISDGGGFGERVVVLPYTGNETVLDAIGQVQGLSDVSSKSMWLSRPGAAELGVAQTLPVDYAAITRDGLTATNYQLFPGDRIYIEADKLIAIDNVIGKILNPVERVFGAVLLGDSVFDTVRFGGVPPFGGGAAVFVP